MVLAAQASAKDALVKPGDWLTGGQRKDAWLEVRDAQTNALDAERKAALSPYSVAGEHEATAQLSAAAVEVIHRVASDPGRLTRSWADDHIEVLGVGVYTELVGVVATATVVDRFDHAMGSAQHELGAAESGEPTRQTPDGVGDVGAWVPQTLGNTMANVSRTLSGVPVTNEAWRGLVDSHYSRGAQFMNLEWDRALNRPQVELVAARVTALSECFY